MLIYSTVVTIVLPIVLIIMIVNVDNDETSTFLFSIVAIIIIIITENIVSVRYLGNIFSLNTLMTTNDDAKRQGNKTSTCVK